MTVGNLVGCMNYSFEILRLSIEVTEGRRGGIYLRVRKEREKKDEKKRKRKAVGSGSPMIHFQSTNF